MRKFITGVLCLFACCFSANASTGKTNYTPLSSGFVIPPDSIQTSCYLYWISNDISLLHVFISEPDDRVPGVNAWFGTDFNRTNTWNGQLDQFTSSLKRINYMFQQGNNVADVAYFIGENAPRRSPSYKGYPQADQAVRNTADEMWGAVDGANVQSRKYGKGMIMNGMDMDNARMSIACQPDCQIKITQVPCHSIFCWLLLSILQESCPSSPMWVIL